VEERGIGASVIILIVVAIVAVVGVGSYFLHFRGKPTISKEQAIAQVKTYITRVEKIPEENVQIDNIELRPPTESEENFLSESRLGKEPPELIWFADVTLLLGDVGPRAGTIWLDAHTGEIVSATFLD